MDLQESDEAHCTAFCLYHQYFFPGRFSHIPISFYNSFVFFLQSDKQKNSQHILMCIWLHLIICIGVQLLHNVVLISAIFLLCSVAKSCLTLCDFMDCSTPGFPITISRSLLKLMFFELVMLPNHLILCHPPSPLLSIFPSIRIFPMSQLFASGGQSIGASASMLPMNIQGWFPLGLTGLISLLSKGLSRVFCGTAPQKHQFLGSHSSLWSDSHICTWLLEKP